MPGWQKVSGHGEKKLAFCCSLCYYNRALKSTQPISGCGADGSALEWGSRGRWFKSSHSDHVEGEAETLPFLHAGFGPAASCAGGASDPAAGRRTHRVGRPLVQIQSLGPRGRGSGNASLFACRIWTSGLLRRRRVRSRRRPADASRRPAAGSNPVTRTTSEQISLCSGVFFCLRQNRRHPLRYICPSSQNRTRCAGLRFCFLLCAHMLWAGCLSARAKSYVKSRKYLFPAICPDFFRCEGALFCFSAASASRWAFSAGSPFILRELFHFGPAAHLRPARACIRFFH